MRDRVIGCGGRHSKNLRTPTFWSLTALCALPAWAQTPVAAPQHLAYGSAVVDLAPFSMATPSVLPESRAQLAQLSGVRVQPAPETAPGSTSNTMLRPDNSDALRNPSVLLGKSSAATTAWEDAQAKERAQPGSYSALELATLHWQALAQKLRWAVAERDQRVGMARFNELDRVLAEFDTALQQQKDASAKASPAEQKAWSDLYVALQSDHMLALLERGRASQTIALYENLRASGAQLKPYALIAVAEALAQERRSAEAVPLYESVLFKDGLNSQLPVDTQFGLIYAYLDVGRFDDAQALLEKIEAQTPALMRLTPTPGRPNAEYSSVKGMRGFLLLYTERLAQAQLHFNALLEEAPFNAGYAEGAAETERLRGHARAALAHFEALNTNHPYDRNIRSGYAQTLLDLNEFAAAKRIGDSLAEDYPDSVFLRKFERQQRAVTGAFFETDAGYGKGSSNALADRSWNIDSRISSSLMSEAWRVFSDLNLGWGDTSSGSSQWVRGGLGLNWQRGAWLAEGKVQQANMGPYRTSAAGRVSYRINDYWQVGATLDGNTKDTPWKARAAAIGARDASVTASFMVNESRRFDFSWQRLMLSDTNRRNGAVVSWRERWISGPRLQLETVVSADASRSRLQDTPYFSPAHDASAQVGLRGQWLTWKNDDRQFFQVVEASTGGYRQADFGTKSLWSVRYEHQWTLGPKMQVRYGLNISSHPYDGVNDRQRNVFINFLMPLS